MKEIEKLLNRIIQRVNINLRELGLDITPYIKDMVPINQMLKFYAFYGISLNHPLDFQFKQSNLAGSYFLGKCYVTNSILYKTDVRGDELKKKGDIFNYNDTEIPVYQDEEINVEDSFLIKTLVHNFSHDPETLERFFIKDTISTHYANIHGSPSDGCFIGPFSTVDLTTIRDCFINAFSYIQAGEISHMKFEPGTIWIRYPNLFNFLYQFPKRSLNKYISFSEGNIPKGLFIDFVESYKEEFQRIFEVVNLETVTTIPTSASLDRYAVVLPKIHIGENVLVSQRAYLENAWLGKGANAQENCYIINSRLEGLNVTAHGAKIIEADLESKVFVGFNSFLRAQENNRLSIGQNSIIMPHTIIDIKKSLSIPSDHLVWGIIRNKKELAENSISFEDFSKIKIRFSRGNMFFEGDGEKFIKAFEERIHHILEANGAFYNGYENAGHAQKNQNISFNTLQPYPIGELEGMYPTINIQP